ncbi:MAG TPA: hypothetical protein VFU98_08120, partial [Microlunatus sp.]|nr:hypothetical protein [Microlunatus sp.]
ARAPRTGAWSSQPAREGVEGLYAAAFSRFSRAADRLAVDGTSQTWDAAWAASQEVARRAVIRRLVAPEKQARELDLLQPAFELLDRAHLADRGAAATLEGVDELTPSEAFEAGRRFERDQEAARSVRSEFLTRWAKIRRKLG